MGEYVVLFLATIGGLGLIVTIFAGILTLADWGRGVNDFRRRFENFMSSHERVKRWEVDNLRSEIQALKKRLDESGGRAI